MYLEDLDSPLVFYLLWLVCCRDVCDCILCASGKVCFVPTRPLRPHHIYLI